MIPCHPKRKPGHKPSADCLVCWLSWMEEKPDAVITAGDLRRILQQAVGITTHLWMLKLLWKKDVIAVSDIEKQTIEF